MSTCFKTLREYLYPDNGHKTFVIPNYQRGYKWSVRIADEKTSVEVLIDSLIAAYTANSEHQFFLQGVTVVEDGDKILLIDGQQRTTTLYLLLWCLDSKNVTGNMEIDLDYAVREQSKSFLNSLKNESFDYQNEDPENLNQDIFYFKQAIEQIKQLIRDNMDKGKFTNFLLNKISLLYIVVDREKAVRTFTMMNGQKAKMHDEELVKAEILHIVSQTAEIANLPIVRTLDDSFIILKEIASMEWETNALRSKYAREWDKWLYWWNREDVKDFFNTHKPMGLLLEYYYKKKNHTSPFSFRNFKHLLPDNDIKQAKNVFKELRDLQKDFEDVYNDVHSFNYLKCALIGSSGDAEDKYNVIMYFIENKRAKEKLEYYAKWRLLGATHIEVAEPFTNDPTAIDGKIDNAHKREERARKMIEDLSKSHVYNVYDDLLTKQLLRLNVEEYNKLNGGKGVKFDFSIWANKSLEHIYPKSRFYHVEIRDDGRCVYVRGDGTELSEAETANPTLLNSDKVFTDKTRFSEHCIGNIVLLYGRNNSEFGNLSFEEKKKKFFNNERSFESRNLLHTISSFANGKWEPANIEESSMIILKILANDYNIERNE
ncbi:MAG: DUF262 domain-containing protein [Bacteroides sp.]|nr:DUF262 domain-containing protein [Bacteroides sp.]